MFKVQNKMYLSNAQFKLFKSLIYDATGINLSDSKKDMLISRLIKRLNELKFNDFTEYYHYLLSEEGREREFMHFINRITTNKTNFFREKYHFELLAQEILPKIYKEKEKAGQKRIRCWSAGCSTGEEAYSIAIVLNEFFKKHHGWDIKILATDIDTECLKTALTGIYDANAIESVSKDFLKKYFNKVNHNYSKSYQIKNILKKNVRVRFLNLFSDQYPFKYPMDFVFCRNVIIYFKPQDKIEIMKKIHNILDTNGYLFIGHSESLIMMNKYYSFLKNTVYKKC